METLKSTASSINLQETAPTPPLKSINPFYYLFEMVYITIIAIGAGLIAYQYLEFKIRETYKPRPPEVHGLEYALNYWGIAFFLWLLFRLAIYLLRDRKKENGQLSIFAPNATSVSKFELRLFDLGLSFHLALLVGYLLLVNFGLNIVGQRGVNPNAGYIWGFVPASIVMLIFGAVAISPTEKPQISTKLVSYDGKHMFISVKWGQLQKWDASKATMLIQAILRQAEQPTITFTVEGNSKEISLVLDVMYDCISIETVQSLVRAVYPDAQVEEYAIARATAFPLYYKYHIFSHSPQYPFYEGLRFPTDLRLSDPLSALTQAMDVLEANERIAFFIVCDWYIELDKPELDYILSQTKAEAGERTPRYYRSKNLGEEMARIMWEEYLAHTTRVRRYNSMEERRYRAKLSQRLYRVSLALVIESPNPQRLNMLSALIPAVQLANDPEVPLIQRDFERSDSISSAEDYYPEYTNHIVHRWLEAYRTQIVEHKEIDTSQFMFTAEELTTLWHLPHDAFTAQKISSIRADKPLPETLRSVEGTLVGINRTYGKNYEVRLPYQNRVLPTAIIGKPGRGKSSLMHVLIHDDIARGGGVCLIDPKGTLVSRILQCSIPPGREDDVVVLDIKAQIDGVYYPPPMNLLGASVEVAEDIAAGRLVTMFERLFSDFQGRKMADTLNMVLLAVLSPETETTILDLYNFLSHPEVRAEKIAQIRDPVVKEYWVDFEKVKLGEKRALADAVLWRLRSFYYNKHLRAITCQRRSLPIAKWVSENCIILVSLGASENVIPAQERYILGSYIINQVDLAAREGVIGASPYMLYIDETQEFVKTSLPSMLSQLREYRLGIVLANQYYRQLLGDTYDALEGTVNTFIGFEVGERDADVLAAYMRPEFTKDDFTRLGKFRAGVSLVYDDVRQRPFSMETIPPPCNGQIDPERELYLRRKSVANLKLRPYDEVAKVISDYYGAEQKPPTKRTDSADDEDNPFEPRR